MKNTYRISALLTVLILAAPLLALAGGPGFGGGVDDGGNTCSAPLDGGSSLLIAAGVGYVSKIFYKRKSLKQNLKKSI